MNANKNMDNWKRSRKGNCKRNSAANNSHMSEKKHSRAALFLTIFAILVFAGVLCANSGNVANAAEGTDDIEYKYYTTITVEKGETLWELALENYSKKYYDSVDDYIEEVKAINGLKNDTIHEGAKLVIVYFSSEYK